MKLNKIIILTAIVLLSINCYAKEVKLQSIKIDYINFDKISIDNLFGFLSKEYKINFSIEPARKGHIVSVHLQNATLKDLLDNILIQNGMLYRIKNNIIYITSNKNYLEKRFTRGKYRKSKITLKYASVTDAVQFLQDMMPGRTVVRTSTENKLYSNLYNADPDLTPPQRQINSQRQESGSDLGFRVFSNNYGSVGTSGYSGYGGYGNRLYEEIIPENVLFIVPFYNENKIYFLSTGQGMINEAKKLIKDIDKPSKQVLIQGQIIEFTVGDGFKSIFDFALRDSKIVPRSENPLSNIGIGNLQYAFLDSALQANIEIAKEEGRASSISSPMLLTMNRVSGVLDLTEDVSIITGVKEGSVITYDSGTVVVPPIPIYETKELGTQLTITPYINSGDEILLKINLKISSLSGNTQTITIPTATGGTEDFTFDSVSESTINTVLSTANKKTIIFGGLIRESISKKETKVPILGDIPILGVPFRNTEEVSKKKELIVILTPIIVDLKHPNANRNMNYTRRNYEKHKDNFNKASTLMNVQTVTKVKTAYDKEIEEFLSK